MEPLVAPSIESGFSRVEATRQELAKEMVRSFVAAVPPGKFSEKLTIMIFPDDFVRGRIDLEALNQFAASECAS